MSRSQLGSFACGLFLCALCAGAAPPGEKGDGLVTVTYDVADLVKNPETWRSLLRVAPPKGADAVEGLVDLLLLSVEPESWRPGAEGGGTMQVLNGTRLEVRATPKRHEQVDALLRALRRGADFGVTFEAELYELDRTFHKQDVAPLFTELPAGRRFAASVGEQLVARIRKQSRPLKSSSVTLPRDKEGDFFSLQTAFVFAAKAKAPGRDPDEVFATGLFGVTFRARVGVTPDRRGVRLKVTQHVTDLVDLEKKTVVDPDTKKQAVIEVPKLSKSSTAGDVGGDDGDTFLLPVQFRSRAAKEKDRPWVLLLRPVIHIDEEQRALGNNPKP